MRLFAALLLAAAAVATTGPANSITRTSANVTGTVDPNGTPTTYHFEYGTSTAYGLRTAEADAGAGDDPVDVEAALSNLTPQTTYHYRLVATGADPGADRTIRTADAPKPPGVTGTRSQDVGPTGATLRSLVDLNDGNTRYFFEYGTTTSYGTRTPERSLGTGDGAREVTEG